MNVPRIFIILLILVAVPAFAESYTVAVFDFDATGMDSSEARQVTNFLRQRLDAADTIQVLPTQAIEYSVFEITVDNSLAIQSGQAVGADFVVVGSLGKIGDLFTVDAKLINTKTTESFEKDGSYEGSLELFLLNTIASLADDLVELMIPREEPPQETTLYPIIKTGRPWYKKWWLWTGVGGAAVIGGILAQGGGGNTETPKTDEYLPEPPALP